MNGEHEATIKLLCVILEFALGLVVAAQVLRACLYFRRRRKDARLVQTPTLPQDDAQAAIDPEEGKAPLLPGEVHCEACGGYGARSLAGCQGVAICWDCKGKGKHTIGR